MTTSCLIKITLLGLLFVLLHNPVAAMTSCHCFQQRSFNRDNPQSVEPYLFATTNNSFLAVIFETPKRIIVQNKMSGSSDDDIWLAHILAPAYGLTFEQLMVQKQKHLSWADLVRTSPLDPEKVEAGIMAALVAGKNDQVLADIGVAGVVEALFDIKKGMALSLMNEGLTRRKLILATLLSEQRGGELVEIIQRAESVPGGWAIISEESGIQLDQMESHWLMVLKQKKAAR